MKVSLITYTGMGRSDEEWHAADIMIFTKQTRLKMSPGLFSEIQSWDLDKKIKELKYMANSIPSSWEFADYAFLIEGVTRAFTHQLVRSRNNSYAQQTMRILDVDGWEYLTGPSIQERPTLTRIYDSCMEKIALAYSALIAAGAAIEDARGVLPTNILTNIVVKANLRSVVDLVRKRSSSRTQGEYRDVLKAMKDIVLSTHPWVSYFIERDFDKAADELDDAIAALPIAKENKTAMVKLLDILRTQQ